MKTLNEKELSIANGGLICANPPTHEERVRIEEKRKREKWLKWVKQEKRRLEGIADIRMRAAEDALRASMRAHNAEMEIKAAQRAVLGLN